MDVAEKRRLAIYKARKKARLTQDEVGRFLGITDAQYSRIENGLSELDDRRWLMLVTFLGMDPQEGAEDLPGHSGAFKPQEALRLSQLLVECQDKNANLKTTIESLENEIESFKTREIYGPAKSIASYLFYRLESTQENSGAKIDWKKIIEAAGFNYDSFLQEFKEFKASKLDEIFQSKT